MGTSLPALICACSDLRSSYGAVATIGTKLGEPVGPRGRQKADEEVEMLRRTAVVLAAGLVAMVVPKGAAAGGMSWFDFDEDYYMAGDTAVGQTGFWISREDRHLLDRTFYAYLIPESRWIEPPNIPSDAIPVGPVSLGGLARITFAVPDVVPGGYTVGICDQPCRHSYVGDLGGGWITVVGSAEEARLLPIIDRLKNRLDRAEWDAIRKARKNLRRDTVLQGELEDVQADLEQAREELSARLVALERRPQPAPGGFDRAGWSVAALALAALVLVTLRRRRASGPAALVPAASEDAAPTANQLGWEIEAAEVEDDRTPVGAR
jgi:hypothetical protein